MDSVSFNNWLDSMRSRGFSNAKIAEELGCSVNSLRAWGNTGAPRYIGLACRAIYDGLDPWKSE